MPDHLLPDPPDPGIDLVGALRWLIADRLAERRTLEEQRVSISAAARALGYNPSFFFGRPWRIPHFGPSGSRFPLSEWRAWLARPERERRAEWDALPTSERAKIMGAA